MIKAKDVDCRAAWEMGIVIQQIENEKKKKTEAKPCGGPSFGHVFRQCYWYYIKIDSLIRIVLLVK